MEEAGSQQLDIGVLADHHADAAPSPHSAPVMQQLGAVVTLPLAPAQPLQPVWDSTAAAWSAQALGVLAASPLLHRSSHSPTAAAAAAPGLYPASASASRSSW